MLKTKPSPLGLNSPPKDWEETYVRILLSSYEEYFEDACTALRRLCCADNPLQLGELVEASMVVPSRDLTLNLEDRSSDPHGVLQILPGLVSIFANVPRNPRKRRFARLTSQSKKSWSATGSWRTHWRPLAQPRSTLTNPSTSRL